MRKEVSKLEFLLLIVSLAGALITLTAGAFQTFRTESKSASLEQLQEVRFDRMENKIDRIYELVYRKR